MIEEDIRNFNKQFSWEPAIENQEFFHGRKLKKAVVLGMGGSHLGADLLNAFEPELGLVVHSNYGLPANDIFVERLIIASSYSGNTEEVIDGLNQSLTKNLETAVMASGGRLMEMAKEKNLPYIQLPSGFQPRMSVGFQIRALAKLLDWPEAFTEAGQLAEQLHPFEFEEKGKALAEKIKDKIPVIYASQTNSALAYNWKIKLNETGKTPAFYNIFPELNHNEINGLSDKFFYLILTDREDHPRIQKRMEVLLKILKDRNLLAETVELTGEGRFYRIFSCLLLADWTAYHIAKQHGSDPDGAEAVEEFKKLIK